jgi:hypothetical protein
MITYIPWELLVNHYSTSIYNLGTVEKPCSAYRLWKGDISFSDRNGNLDF